MNDIEEYLSEVVELWDKCRLLEGLYEQDVYNLKRLCNEGKVKVEKTELVCIKNYDDAMKQWHSSKLPYIKAKETRITITNKVEDLSFPKCEFIFLVEYFYKCKFGGYGDRRIKKTEPKYSYTLRGCSLHSGGDTIGDGPVEELSEPNKTWYIPFGNISFLCKECRKCKCGGEFRFTKGGCTKECFGELLKIRSPLFRILPRDILKVILSMLDLFTPYAYMEAVLENMHQN